MQQYREMRMPGHPIQKANQQVKLKGEEKVKQKANGKV